MSACRLCPRLCGADRAAGERGFCGMQDELRVVRAALHPFEEPPISGKRGSGTVFFVGCSLLCVFCQNRAIHADTVGKTLSERQLADLFLLLQEKGAHNVNLVTATHFSHRVKKALELAKPHLRIPVIWNSGGYERVETLQELQGLVDIYLPDFKFISGDLAALCANAPDYAEVATAAICEMHRQVGEVCFDSEGIMTRGVMLRHLVLPSQRADSIAVLEHIARVLPVGEIRLSLMRQYTPEFLPQDAPRALCRRVTSFEYDSVAQRAVALGFEGFFQGRESASAAFTPDFAEKNFLDLIV